MKFNIVVEIEYKNNSGKRCEVKRKYVVDAESEEDAIYEGEQEFIHMDSSEFEDVKPYDYQVKIED